MNIELKLYTIIKKREMEYSGFKIFNKKFKNLVMTTEVNTILWSKTYEGKIKLSEKKRMSELDYSGKRNVLELQIQEVCKEFK